MENLSRATRGGVGTVLIGLALVAAALTGGWLSGSIYDGRIAPHGCGDCTSAASAAEAQPTRVALALAVAATPTADASATPASADDFPYVSAQSFALIDSGCGALIHGRNEHEHLPPASLTKLMTAAVAVDHAPVTKMITSHVDGAALYNDTGSTIMGLRPGMELSLIDLLYGLLLPSGNDAAIAIAEGISGTQPVFVELMNEKAKSLALDDTHFTNPHGLDEPGLYSSAYDMGMLSRYVLQNPTLSDIVATQSYQPRWDGPPVWNGNKFLTQYEGADGVKIGYTEQSQQTMVASATRGGRRLIASIMQSTDRYQDAERLLDWGFSQPSPCP